MKTSVSYFIKDPVHDFAAAHHVIRKHCMQRKSEWQEKYGTELQQIWFRSDRWEFLCVGFVFLMCGLSYELRLNMFWHYGAANHNKDLCDADGHVSKTGMDDGVVSKALQFHPGEEPVVTAARFCNDYLNGPDRKIQREYHAVLDGNVSHAKCASVRIYNLCFDPYSIIISYTNTYS